MTYYEVGGVLVPSADASDKVRWFLLGAILPVLGTVLVWLVNRFRFGAYPLYRKDAAKWSLLGLCLVVTFVGLMDAGPSVFFLVWM